jgi:hypothetical protein
LADQPDARALLDVARESLMALVPDTEPRHHYTLRMVAAAMAIAAREIAAAPADAGDAALLARVVACPADGVGVQRARHADLVAATRAKVAIGDPRVLD